MRQKISIAFITLLLWPTLACFWDKDTIEMERQDFPEALELICGKFLRHSPEFYYWRAKDRESQLRVSDNPSYYDDLAVSYAKLGELEKAINVMLQKETKYPGKYETYANLGTFYLHHAELDKGLEYIKKAIEINPDAHFGREKYQMYLAEYLQSKVVNDQLKFPLSGSLGISFNDDNAANFYNFLLEKEGNSADQKLSEEAQQKAVTGLLGMMKFGNFKSPVLLEALGDLLMADCYEEAARELAAKAYLAASRTFDNKKIKDAYYFKANSCLAEISEATNADNLMTALVQEIAQGDAFYEDLRSKEIEWILSGKNPEIQYTNTYYNNTIEPITAIEPAHNANINLGDFHNKKMPEGDVVPFGADKIKEIDEKVKDFLNGEGVDINKEWEQAKELPSAARSKEVPHINNRMPVPASVVITAIVVLVAIVLILRWKKVL
ncbi:hypothetical protein GC194_01410 [bacterium]|nr:hypothetical protein [bacterium]